MPINRDFDNLPSLPTVKKTGFFGGNEAGNGSCSSGASDFTADGRGEPASSAGVEGGVASSGAGNEGAARARRGCGGPTLADLGRVERAAMESLSVRERNLLRLVYRRGASHGEVAGVLGVSRRAVRRMVRQALARATDPMHLALLRSWRRLTPSEQRLAYLHRILGLSLREIARLGLVDGPAEDGRSEGPACLNTLRAWMRRIERGLWRAERRRLQGEAD